METFTTKAAAGSCIGKSQCGISCAPGRKRTSAKSSQSQQAGTNSCRSANAASPGSQVWCMGERLGSGMVEMLRVGNRAET
jgi:hypothetical protein